ncbi:MAG: 6,7-dimethyl-8-ribityllumazine synthase [Gemmatimonadales bacterium]
MKRDRQGGGGGGPPAGSAPVLVAVSRFNELISRKLLEGAAEQLRAAGYSADDVEVIWVPGAYELPVVVDVGLASGRYEFAVALGAVVRGETPHFDHVAGQAARGLADVALKHGRAVGFGVLTCDSMEQALARAGGESGNKGAEAASAALETSRVLRALRHDASN